MRIDIRPALNSGALLWKKYCPEILVGTGVVGTVVSGVMACKATLGLAPVLENHRQNVEVVHNKFVEGKDEHGKQRALTRVYAKTGLDFARLYGPSVTVEVLSIVSILTGTGKLRKRNMELAAAYALIDGSFKKYRSRVVDRFGEEVDQELRTGGHQEKIEIVEKDASGKEKKVKKSVTVVDGMELSDYARIFAYGESEAAEPNDDYNIFFLRSQQELANHQLKAFGFLFLNDVYDMLGFKKSIPAQTVGWVYDKNSEDHGDNYIDFRIKEIYRKKADSDEYEKVYLIDPNVDGDILTHALDKGLIER